MEIALRPTEMLAGTALVEVDASNDGLLEIIRGCERSILICPAGLVDLCRLCASYLRVKRSHKETDKMIKHSEEIKQEGEAAQAKRGIAEN
jgi:hypothetical protein